MTGMFTSLDISIIFLNETNNRTKAPYKEHHLLNGPFVSGWGHRLRNRSFCRGQLGPTPVPINAWA